MARVVSHIVLIATAVTVLLAFLPMRASRGEVAYL